MKRRDLLLSTAGLAFLAGCGGTLPTIPINIGVKLPPGIQAVIDDATAAVTKVESLGLGGSIGELISKVKSEITALTSGTGDTKVIISGIVSALGTIATLLPPPYGTIALAIETLLPIIGGLIGTSMAARRPTGMSPTQARMILMSR
jgi:hypothetical protein